MSVKLDRVDTRGRLPPRRDPYWQRLGEGRYIGFRLMAKGALGTWLARCYNGTSYVYEPLGDFVDRPEKERFDAAKRAAEDWFQHLDMGGSTERVTVKKACESYVAKLRLESSEAAARDAEGRFARLVVGDAKRSPPIPPDPIARVELKKLTPRHMAEWKARAIEAGGTLGTFNRNATSLRAALNLAYERRDVASDHAWRGELKPFKDADGRRELYLKPPSRAKLLDKASDEARRFAKVLNLLPLRPGDVAKLKVEAFDAHQRTLAVPTGKTKSRIIPLSGDAVALFKECAKDKLPGAWLVSRDSGDQWKKEAWRDAIKDAAAAAKLPKATCAYTLRHCVITDLVTGGPDRPALDLFTVAKLAGTSIAMIEKNYGHLQQERARSALEALAKM